MRAPELPTIFVFGQECHFFSFKTQFDDQI